MVWNFDVVWNFDEIWDFDQIWGFWSDLEFLWDWEFWLGILIGNFDQIWNFWSDLEYWWDLEYGCGLEFWGDLGFWSDQKRFKGWFIIIISYRNEDLGPSQIFCVLWLRIVGNIDVVWDFDEIWNFDWFRMWMWFGILMWFAILMRFGILINPRRFFRIRAGGSTQKLKFWSVPGGFLESEQEIPPQNWNFDQSQEFPGLGGILEQTGGAGHTWVVFLVLQNSSRWPISLWDLEKIIKIKFN